MILVAIEGNIGVGKSTVLEALRAAYRDDSRVAIVDEPVELWKQRGLLEAVYDGSLSRTVFQQVAIASRAGALGRAARAAGVEVLVSERSPQSDRHVFASTNVGGTDKVAYEVSYNDVVSLLPQFARRRFILLRASVDTVAERIRSRDRTAERGIARAYLEEIEAAHARFAESFSDETRVVDAEAGRERVVACVLEEVRAALAGA